MTKDDRSDRQLTSLVHPSDLGAAIGLLTRLPFPVDEELAVKRGARAAWAWPLVGLLPVLVATGLATILLSLSVPAVWAAIFWLSVHIMLTGAMHEDGLADSADGFWGGYDRVRRLAIMKDSHIGSYGVIALVLSIAARVSTLAVILPATGAFTALLVVGITSRLPMVILMAALPNARGRGLSESVGRPSQETTLLATVITLVLALILTPAAILPLFVYITFTTTGIAALAKSKIGGQTGDVLGTAQQITEITALAVFAALLS